MNTPIRACTAAVVVLLCMSCLWSCGSRVDFFEKSDVKRSDLSVELCSPTDRSLEVPRDSRVSMRFSHRMDRDSVYRSFRIHLDPYVLGAKDGSFQWFDGDRVFVFDPAVDFPPLTRVQVTVDSEAMDVDERHLLGGYSFGFFTAEGLGGDSGLSAELLSPDPTDTAVDVYPRVVVGFNRQILMYTAFAAFRLRSLDGGDVRTAGDGTVHFGPTSFSFTPKVRLEEDTDYLVEFPAVLDNGRRLFLQDLSGNELEISFSPFHTTPGILYVSPRGDDAASGLAGHPKRSIGSAVARSRELGFQSTGILVASGEYHENVVLSDGVRLIGGYAGDDFEARDHRTILYPSADGSTVEIRGVRGCSVDGLTIYGNEGPSGNAAVHIHGGAGSAAVRNCTVLGLPDDAGTVQPRYGIRVDDSSSIEITGNQINADAAASSGIIISGSELVTLEDNMVSGGKGTFTCGLVIENSVEVRVRRNELQGGSGETSCGLRATGSYSLVVSGGKLTGGTGDGPVELSCGIHLRNLSSDAVVSDCTGIDGGDAPLARESIGIFVENASARISGNLVISGGTGLRNTGILLSGGQNHSVLERNGRIEGGSAGGLRGIAVTGSAAPVIQDNQLITGGSTPDGDAVGILVADRSQPRILRNTIVGGRSTGGSSNTITGVRYEALTADQTQAPALFNNFIVGGRGDTSASDSCCGVYLKNRNVGILNNTIDGGGNPSGYRAAYGIYAVVTGGVWNISPVVLNNYILGGNTGHSFGLFLDDSRPELGCAIFNNLFNMQNCEFLAGTGNSSTGTLDALNGGIGALLFEPDPARNYLDPAAASDVFVDAEAADYHVLPSFYQPFRDRGYAGEDYSLLYREQGALLDIDGEAREVGEGSDYSLVDLGADRSGDAR